MVEHRQGGEPATTDEVEEDSMGMAEKGPGRGRGRFTAAGAQANLEARVAAIEDFLADQIEAGNVSEPEIDEEPTEETSA
jgi:hypothetical protein